MNTNFSRLVIFNGKPCQKDINYGIKHISYYKKFTDELDKANGSLRNAFLIKIVRWSLFLIAYPKRGWGEGG
jgi:hypothetical protein